MEQAAAIKPEIRQMWPEGPKRNWSPMKTPYVRLHAGAYVCDRCAKDTPGCIGCQPRMGSFGCAEGVKGISRIRGDRAFGEAGKVSEAHPV